MSIIRLNHKYSKVVGISSDIFGNVRTSSEVAWTFPEIPVMTRQNSHAFDSEKVGRYITYNIHILQLNLYSCSLFKEEH